jgi:hypothetical protein
MARRSARWASSGQSSVAQLGAAEPDAGRLKARKNSARGASSGQPSTAPLRARGVAVVWRSSTAWCGGRGSVEVAQTKRLRAAAPSLGGVRGGATQGRAARVAWTNRLFTRVLVRAAFSGRAMRPRDSSLHALPLHLRRRGRESSRRWCRK